MGPAADPRDRAWLFERALAGVALGVAILDLAGRFLHANPACCALLGRDEAALQATDCLTLAADADRAQYRDCLRLLRAGESAGFTIEVRYQLPGSGTVAVLNQVAPLRDTIGRPAAFVAVAQGRHPLAQRAGREALDATIAHEVRTPLTVIQAGLGLLESSAGGRLLPGERDLLTNVQRNASRLRRTIADILAFNQLQALASGHEELPLDLRPVVRAALATLESLLERRYQDPALELATPLPVVGDARQLEQAVLSVLYAARSAALPAARLTISGRSARGTTELTVSASESRAIGAGGGNLGLEVARGIIGLHGGELRTELSAGSQPALAFIIALPSGVAGTGEE